MRRSFYTTGLQVLGASGWLWLAPLRHGVQGVYHVTDDFGNLTYAPRAGLSVSLWDTAYHLFFGSL